MSSLRRLAAAALATAALTTPAVAAQASATPAPARAAAALVADQHGTDPTAESITRNGSYTFTSVRVPGRFGSGFAGGTLYYPTNTQGERFGGIVTMPGFMEPGSVMNVYGPRLASHGFVVLVADATTFMDQPAARARTAKASLEALKRNQTVQNILDPERMALIGHSMGGGGVLEAAATTELRTVIAVHPWDQQPQAMQAVQEPALVIGGGIDNIAPLNQYAKPIYQAVGAQQKALLVALAGTHWAGTVDDPAIMGRNVAWLKFYVDADLRYGQFVCAPAATGTTFTSTMCGR